MREHEVLVKNVASESNGLGSNVIPPGLTSQFPQTGNNNSTCLMGQLGELSLIYVKCFHTVSGIKLAALIIWALI